MGFGGLWDLECTDPHVNITQLSSAEKIPVIYDNVK